MLAVNGEEGAAAVIDVDGGEVWPGHRDWNGAHLVRYAEEGECFEDLFVVGRQRVGVEDDFDHGDGEAGREGAACAV